MSNLVLFRHCGTDLLVAVVEAIYHRASHCEPVIVIDDVRRWTGKGLDDSGNPNRWRNTTEDWTSGD